ncbi:MAG: diacylglycerol kinase family protein [Lactimicrobium sp.]|jgi:diacylglycerol kinase|uniref:diacylglycerol kinase family protein n=1 Tax=Lactimicrobium sp. TaxID=2563780 RepID=UPI002F35B0FB
MISKFKAAFAGVADGLGHRSVRIQYELALCAFIAGWIMKLSAEEWVAVIICIGMVITAEMLNTCIEKICDMYSTEIDERIKVIKDVAAGAVLIASLAAFVTAMVILAVHLKGNI